METAPLAADENCDYEEAENSTPPVPGSQRPSEIALPPNKRARPTPSAGEIEDKLWGSKVHASELIGLACSIIGVALRDNRSASVANEFLDQIEELLNDHLVGKGGPHRARIPRDRLYVKRKDGSLVGLEDWREQKLAKDEDNGKAS